MTIQLGLDIAGAIGLLIATVTATEKVYLETGDNARVKHNQLYL